MKEEIQSALKIALERGASLDEAVQSFINAGYNEPEVRDAASAITAGATVIMNASQKDKPKPIPQTPQSPPQTPLPAQPIQAQTAQIPIKKKSKAPLIAALIFLVLSIAVLILAIVFWEPILNLFNS